MLSKWVITYILINGLYCGYNLLTNLLLTSWDIQVGCLEPLKFGPSLIRPSNPSRSTTKLHKPEARYPDHWIHGPGVF